MSALHHSIEYAFETGTSFSPNERVQLSSSIPILGTQAKRKTLVLWGKIFGYKADYTIVEAYNDDAVAEPEIYYTLDEGRNFNLLGTFSSVFAACPGYDNGSGIEQAEWKQTMLLGMRGPFMGDPAYEYRVTARAAGKDGEAVQSLKESVRLALFIEEFDYECRVVPRGAYVKVERQATATAAGMVSHNPSDDNDRPQIRCNAAFNGLARSLDGALTLRNFYHLRAQDPYRRLLARNQNALFTKSVLEKLSEHPLVDAVFEPLTEDIPSGTWQLRYDAFHDVMIGKNIRFPGSLFYHVPETSVYGSLYMGDGNINVNTAFEL
jgi:radial spoke head protein 9